MTLKGLHVPLLKPLILLSGEGQTASSVAAANMALEMRL